MTKGEEQSLAGIELLAELTEAERRSLEKACAWRSYPAHEQIIDRHSDSRDIFFVVSGRVRVVNYSLSGREISFDDIDTGGYFGELAAIDGQPRSANVVALNTTTVATLSPQRLEEMARTHPAISFALLKRLAQIIRRATDRIMDLSTLGAHNRVHAEILRLARENEKDDNTALVHPIPIHSDIASRVSTTRETVARVLGDLSRAKLVTRDRNALIVHDVERLEDMVEEFRGE